MLPIKSEALPLWIKDWF